MIGERIELIVCGPNQADVEGTRIEDVSARVADQCLDLPVRLIAANQLYEETFGHVPVGMIDAAWYRYIMHPRFRAAGPRSKRLVDLVLGSIIGIVFLPVLAVAAIAIKLHDGGPVFYRQRRLGEFGEEFEILKLRSMRTNAEAYGPQWSVVGDDRVTPVGRFLRRTHVDEIPQLFNVLRGNIRWLGPVRSDLKWCPNSSGGSRTTRDVTWSSPVSPAGRRFAAVMQGRTSELRGNSVTTSSTSSAGQRWPTL